MKKFILIFLGLLAQSVKLEVINLREKVEHALAIFDYDDHSVSKDCRNHLKLFQSALTFPAFSKSDWAEDSKIKAFYLNEV